MRLRYLFYALDSWYYEPVWSGWPGVADRPHGYVLTPSLCLFDVYSLHLTSPDLTYAHLHDLKVSIAVCRDSTNIRFISANPISICFKYCQIWNFAPYRLNIMMKAKKAIWKIQLKSVVAPSCMKIKSFCILYSFNGFYLNIFKNHHKKENVAAHGLVTGSRTAHFP